MAMKELFALESLHVAMPSGGSRHWRDTLLQFAPGPSGGGGSREC